MRAEWPETLARPSRIAVAALALTVVACGTIVGVGDIHTADAGVDSALGDASIDGLGMIVDVAEAGVDGAAGSDAVPDGEASSGDGGQAGEGGDACQSSGMACSGVACGTATDNCGDTIACPNTCTGSESCMNDTCVCTPNQAPCNGIQCGMVPDGCGQLVTCPDTCPATDTCTASNTCQCMVNGTTTCGTAQCGTGMDSCGNTISCGSCGINHTCSGGVCTCTCSNGCFTDGTCCAIANLDVSVCYCTTSGEYSDSWFGTHINGCPLTCTGSNPEPVEFRVSSDFLPGMTALNRYKYQDSNNQTRYFLSIVGCENIPNCSLDTTLGYVYTTELCGTTIPLYRYYNSAYQNRWSSTSAAAPGGYMSQVITGYGWAP